MTAVRKSLAACTKTFKQDNLDPNIISTPKSYFSRCNDVVIIRNSQYSVQYSTQPFSQLLV